MTEKTILENIAKIGTMGKELDNLIHTTAVACLEVIISKTITGEASGNCQFMTKLVKAMSKGSRKNALIKWCETYGRMKWQSKDKDGVPLVTDQQSFKMLKGWQEKIDIQEADANPFWLEKVNEGGDYHEFNFMESIARLIKRAEKALEENNSADSKVKNLVTTDQVVALRKLARVDETTAKQRTADTKLA